MSNRESLEKQYKGKKIQIDSMFGEPQYTGKVGIVKYADDANQLHGTWGGLAVIVGKDDFHIID